jgi:enoyl-CoA hydratase/carnithine racemase
VYEHLKVEQRGDVAVVRIDRPPANALHLELLEEGARVRDELASSAPGAVVITGRDGFFSAGVDLKLAPTLDAEGQRAMVEGINRLFAGWYAFSRPVVCAVNGHAIAGGLILALCGDYRVGSTDGKYGLTELRAGIPYPAVAMAAVRAELTPAVARVLVLGSDLVNGQRAFELGLFDELAVPDRVLTHGLEVAEKLAEMPAAAYELVKRQLRGETIEAMEKIVAGRDDPLAAGWIGDETADASADVLSRARG